MEMKVWMVWMGGKGVQGRERVERLQEEEDRNPSPPFVSSLTRTNCMPRMHCSGGTAGRAGAYPSH